MLRVNSKFIWRLLDRFRGSIISHRQAGKGFHFSTVSRNFKVKQNLKSAWKRYVSFIDTYGWKAQCINTCVLVGIGDVLSQCIVYQRLTYATFDFGECARYFGVGLLMLGPTMHMWYTGLDRIVRSTGMRAAVTKMLMDQTMFLPPYVAAIIAVMGILTHESQQKIANDLKSDFLPIMGCCYMGWPWIQIVNFRYVPLKHRIFVMNVVGLFYNTLIAWKVEKNRHEEADRKQRQHEEADRKRLHAQANGKHLQLHEQTNPKRHQGLAHLHDEVDRKRHQGLAHVHAASEDTVDLHDVKQPLAQQDHAVHTAVKRT